LLRQLHALILATALVAALTTAALVGAAAPATAKAPYTPESGALMNVPMGTKAEKHRLAVKLRKSIWAAPKGSVIKIAVYSFDRKELGDALAAACDRGVAVQIVINDNWISRQVKRMQRKLGTSTEPRFDDRCRPQEKPETEEEQAAVLASMKPSFMKVCYQACRLYGAGNQHMKIFMFSRSGNAQRVIMLGSNNMTHYAARTHWNDMFTLYAGRQMWKDYSRIIAELAEDRPATPRYLKLQHGDFTTEFGALEGASRAQDPVGKRLDRVRCKAVGGTGSKGRTVIRISMYAWVGDRGKFLARKVAGLSNKGCVVRAILSQPAKGVKQILRPAGVKMRTADLDTDEDPETGFAETRWEHFTHEKWMALNGTWAGKGRRIVWTGSENWSNKSLQNDEVTLGIDRAGAHNAYARHFDAMWSNPDRTRPL
jgi:phosphatidylserine/phosphatidylglycerophosphate/cardiolipin synthase-like enzyme